MPLVSFILGFYFNENSAGAGGYNGDSSWIRKNIDIFLQNNFRDAILHPDFFGNRSPLIYIIHKIINPFFGDFEKYRVSGFLFSLLGPIFFYLFLTKKYFETDKKILFLISSILYLSPYYRTSAFWGLNENYGIVTAILSFLFLYKVKNENNNNVLNISLLILFSSVTVYFDLKLLIIPLICFFSILNWNLSLKKKIIICLVYFIFSLPYFYLIFNWGGLVPIATQTVNIKTITSLGDISKIYQIHFGYCATLIAFYLLPIALFVHKNVFNKILEMFKFKFTYFILFLIIIYIIYNFYFFDFKDYTITNHWVGLGVVHKLTNIITSNVFYHEILTYIFFLFSLLLILFYYYQSKSDILLISYFFIISLLLWPLMQEYFDPIIFILAFSVFNSIRFFNKINSLFLLIYFSTFLLIANVYYT